MNTCWQYFTSRGYVEPRLVNGTSRQYCASRGCVEPMLINTTARQYRTSRDKIGHDLAIGSLSNHNKDGNKNSTNLHI